MAGNHVPHWPTANLGDCGRWYSGGTPDTARAEYWDGDIPWVTASSLHDFYITTSERKVTQLGLESGTRLVPENSILFVVRGMSLKTEFRVGIAKRPVAFGQDCKAIIARADIAPLFLANVLRAKASEILGLADEASHGTGRLQTRALSELKVPVPPLKEQQAIACILGALDDKIELNRRRNRTLEAMARTIFQSWFVDFDPVKAKAAGRKPPGLKPNVAALFPDSFEDSPLGPIPAGWRVGTVRELCAKVENGGTPKRQIEDYWTPSEVPWLTSGEVRQQFVVETENFISRSGLENSSAKMWPPYTTVVALYGATAGIATMLGIELCANQACCGLVPTTDSACFIHLTFSSSLSLLQQQARGSAQQNLSQSIVAELRCVLPPQQLLTAFEQQAHPIYQRCITGITESRTLAALRDTILPKLISGELRVPDTERIVGRRV